MQRPLRLLLSGLAVSCVLALRAAAGADPSDNPDDAHGETHSGPPELSPFTGRNPTA